MPAQCRWHYIGYPLSNLSLEQVLLLANLSAFHLTEYCGQTVSFLTQQQVESLLSACNGYIKVLSTVRKLCGLTQAQCSMGNRAFMQYMFQQCLVIKVNSYLIIDVVGGILDKLFCPHLKKYFKKTTYLPGSAVVSATSYLPKSSYLAYWYKEFCTALWNTYSYISRKLYKQLEVSPIGFQPKVLHLLCCL